jgi:hypothetical protein
MPAPNWSPGKDPGRTVIPFQLSGEPFRPWKALTTTSWPISGKRCAHRAHWLPYPERHQGLLLWKISLI